MGALKTIFAKVISWLFFIASAIILFSIIFIDGGDFSTNFNYPAVSVVIGLALAAIAIIVFRKINQKKSRSLPIKWEIVIVLAFMLVFLLFGIYIIRTLWVHPDWDFGELYRAAINKVTQDSFGAQYEYISRFPFQLFLIYMFVAVLRLTISFLNPHTALMLLNLAFILGTILLFYFSIRKMFNSKTAAFSLVLFLIFSPILLYVPIFYSDTISMFFVMACFYLSLHLCDKSLKIAPRIILSLLFGLLLFCGFQVKATTAILTIALAIFVLLIKERPSPKLVAISFSCIAFVFIPPTLVFSSIRQSKVDASLEIPKAHWVMMGLKDYGQFNITDYADITLANQDASSDVQIAEIKARLENYGFWGYGGFLLKKLSYTWGDGTYFVSEKLSRSPSHPDSAIYQFVAKDGQNFKIYNVIMNGAQVMLLATIVVGAFLSRKDRSIIMVVKLSILGLTLFLLIWETRSRYLINYLPVLFICFIYSLDQISKIKKRKLGGHKK